LKRFAVFLLFLSLALYLVFFPATVRPEERVTPDSWEVHFSPNGDCTAVIINELTKARRSIFVQAYSFTSAPIAKALLGANKRGVKVEVILDKSQQRQKYSSVTFFMNAGIPIRIDGAHGIAHNKVIIIDGETVITGSFNFTKAAEEKNAENLLVIRDKKLAALYIKNWQAHALHSEISTRRGG
jgi:phosphatidylserine/phosphatidylglycerophosphate/cardiolipin synthase-like enzyme